MHEAYIDCVKKDWQGVITHIGIGGRVYEVTHVVQELLENRYPLYTQSRIIRRLESIPD